MEAVAQLAELSVVVRAVVGSSPIGLPNFVKFPVRHPKIKRYILLEFYFGNSRFDLHLFGDSVSSI